MAAPDAPSFGALLHRFRLDAGLTQEGLAIGRRLGDENYLSFELDALGSVALERGDLAAAQAAFQAMLAPLLPKGYLQSVSQTLESLACLAGAAEVVGEVYGRGSWRPRRLEPERWFVPARAPLGDSAAQAAWTAGRGLSVEQAVAIALADVAPTFTNEPASHASLPDGWGAGS